MKNSLFKKGLVFAIILLFIGTYINSVTGQLIIGKKQLLLEEQCNSFEDLLFDLKIRTSIGIGRFNSLSGCIIKNDTVVWSKGYGWARPGRRPTPDTVYMAASISKAITATAFMQLYEKKMFNLTDDVNKYLDFEVRNPKFPGVNITFQMLLAHRSSLNDNDQLKDWWFSLMMGFTSALSYSEYPYPRIKEYLLPNGSLYEERIWRDKPPGEEDQYTSVSFILLEHLFNIISGESLEEYCRKNIFDPLNMKNTSFQLSHFDRKQLAIPYVRLSVLKIPMPHFQLAHASSNLRTTVDDLSHFLIAHMNGGVYNGVQILKESTVEEMHRIQYPNGYYGLGWQHADESGDGIQGHGGLWLGCDSNMRMRPSDNIGVIFFMNGAVDVDIPRMNFAYNEIAQELFSKAEDY